MSSCRTLQTSPFSCQSSILVSIDLILSERAGVRALNKVLRRLAYPAQSWNVLHNPRIAWQSKDSYIVLHNTRIAQIPTPRGTYNIYIYIYYISSHQPAYLPHLVMI